MIDFKKLKTLSDFENLLSPMILDEVNPMMGLPDSEQMILRMLVRPKYGKQFHIPKELHWLHVVIKTLYDLDTRLTGIHNKWTYVTVRHGTDPNPDNEWHLDGGSLRTELIPERNYIWMSSEGLEYMTGKVKFPEDFDPVKENMFTAILDNISSMVRYPAPVKKWMLVHPFIFHRRNPAGNGKTRTFIRITFPDIEIRDVNCTQNPLLHTEAYGRDPVKSFRDKLS